MDDVLSRQALKDYWKRSSRHDSVTNVVYAHLRLAKDARRYMNPDIHHVPGRLRVRIPRVKRNQALAEAVERRFADLPGVTSARANVVTGSVTLLYDPMAVTGDDLIAALAESGYVAGDIASSTAPRLIEISASRASEMLAKAAFSFIVEKAIQRSALALIGALA